MSTNPLQAINEDVTGRDGPLHFDGRLIINGSVLPGASVSASGDIVVRGRLENARIESTGGGVYVDQGIVGENAVVRAFGDVKAPFVRNANIECLGSAYVRDIIFQSQVRAKNFVQMKDGDGIIEASRVTAGMEISLKSLGSFEAGMDDTVLLLENVRQKELFEISLIYEQRLKQKSHRMNELEKVIKVVRILGSRVTTLSAEKKHDLALKVKEYNELQEQISEILREKQKVLQEKEKTNALFRSIVVTHEVFPGVEVRIDNAKVKVNKRYNNVIFYKSGIVIIGDLDAFMERKRLMP